MKDKLRNPWFWIGMISVIFASAGIEVATLTSWPLLAAALIGIVNNPFCLMCVVVALVSIWNDNSTSGLDGADKIKSMFKINK